MLTVVEHQEHLIVRQAMRKNIEQRLLRVLGDSEDVGHLSGHRAAARERCELDVPDAAGKPIGAFRGELQCEPRLAAAS